MKRSLIHIFCVCVCVKSKELILLYHRCRSLFIQSLIIYRICFCLFYQQYRFSIYIERTLVCVAPARHTSNVNRPTKLWDFSQPFGILICVWWELNLHWHWFLCFFFVKSHTHNAIPFLMDSWLHSNWK